jgi:hypothetical protein
MAADDGGDLVVLQDGAGQAERRLGVIEEGVHRGADRLHVDPMLVHLGKPQVEVPALPRHRPLHHLARDLHNGRAVRLRHELRRNPRRLLAQPANGFLRQDVGVDVDSGAAGH